MASGQASATAVRLSAKVSVSAAGLEPVGTAAEAAGDEVGETLFSSTGGRGAETSEGAGEGATAGGIGVGAETLLLRAGATDGKAMGVTWRGAADGVIGK